MQTPSQAADHASQNRKAIKALRKPAVLEKTGLSNTHLYRLIQGGKFPKPHKLSERVSVWDEAEIDDWLDAKFTA